MSQAHISLRGGEINLNLADPFAVLAIAAVSVQMLFSRQLPEWNNKYFNLALAAISLLLVFSFIHGWFYIGITQWAFTGRLIGWVVILGYLAAGYLITAHVGAHGQRRFSETMIATAAIIVILQVVLRFLDLWGINPGVNITSYFQGYAGNRNAFAFQLLICLALLLDYDSVHGRKNQFTSKLKKKYYTPFFLAVILSGIFWTSSRAGVGVAILVLIGITISRLVNNRTLTVDKRTLSIGCFLTVALCVFVWLLSSVEILNEKIMSNVPSSMSHLEHLFTNASTSNSNQERLLTFVYAIELWKESPVFGAGLGVFIEKSSIWFERPLVVHNTFLWVLAELGIIGILVLLSTFFLMFKYAYKNRSLLPARILLLVLIIFVLFSMVHEIFYQRIFWLVIGVVLAKPFSSKILL